jgi:hypothetical protein
MSSRDVSASRDRTPFPELGTREAPTGNEGAPDCGSRATDPKEFLVTTTTAATTPAVRNTPPLTRTAGLLAALLLLAEAALALAVPDQMGDHTTGLGRLSEALAGAAFIAGAAALLPLVPHGRSRILFGLAPVGLGTAGLTMVSVVMVRSEPVEWLFLLAVGALLIGTISAGIIGVRRGLWPLWTGVAVALLVPVLFLAPLNSVFLAAIFAAVAISTTAPGTASQTPSE